MKMSFFSAILCLLVVHAHGSSAVQGFADGLNVVSEMQKAGRSKAEQIAALCPVIRTHFDLTYVHGEFINWMRNGKPSDIDQLSRQQQESLIIAYFAANMITRLKPLWDALKTGVYQYTLIETRAPVDSATQKYVQHTQEVVFRFRQQDNARHFITFMTPGESPLIRTATLDDMYGKYTLTSVAARTVSRKPVSFLQNAIATFTEGALQSCP